MNYNQTLEFLFSSLVSYQEKGPEAYKPGLERITAFCKHLGNPQRNYFTIHVAGTNGKGSVSHMLASVLQQAGYRTGLYTSPHLRDFRERILVDGEMIPKQKVVNFVDKHYDCMKELGLSFFEMSTALAFDYFDQSDVEVAVIDLLHQGTPLTISLRALTEGMRTVASGTALQGRWQKLGDKPLTICDTGHNAHGIRYVAEQLAATPHRDLYCVLGFVNDKDLSSVLPLFPKEARYIFTQPGNERALPAGKLAEKAAAYGLRGEVADTVSGALARAREMASEEDMIFIGGSNFVVAEVLE